MCEYVIREFLGCFHTLDIMNDAVVGINMLISLSGEDLLSFYIHKASLICGDHIQITESRCLKSYIVLNPVDSFIFLK